MSKTPIVDAEILKMKAALRNYPEYDRIFEQYQSMRDLARELEEKLAAEQANRTWQPIATAPQGYSNDVLLGSAKDRSWVGTVGGADMSDAQCRRNVPTHWMPLPKPPEE